MEFKESRIERSVSEVGADNSPFLELEDSKDIKGLRSDFYDIPNHPEFVVRKSFVSLTTNKDGKHGGVNYQEAAEYWAERVKEFQKIGEKYGLHIARTSYLIGNDPKTGTPALFAVTDRIKGQNLDALTSLDASAEKEFDEMYAGNFSHLWDSFREKGYIWGDFDNKQVVYGIAPGENEPHPYIVDVDPNLYRWDERRIPMMNEYFFWWCLFKTFCAMKSVETNTKVSFTKARETFSRIIQEVPIPADEEAQEMRDKAINGINTVSI